MLFYESLAVSVDSLVSVCFMLVFVFHMTGFIALYNMCMSCKLPIALPRIPDAILSLYRIQYI